MQTSSPNKGLRLHGQSNINVDKPRVETPEEQHTAELQGTPHDELGGSNSANSQDRFKLA